jgi:RNA polymerase sigma-70 factor (ECF subfamily)
VERVEDERAHGGGRRRRPVRRIRPLEQLVDGLDRDQRVAFVLTQMVGCSYVEAAEICGVPVGTIRSRVARGTRAPHRRSRGGGDRLRVSGAFVTATLVVAA